MAAPEECAANALPVDGPALRDVMDDNLDGVNLVNIGFPAASGSGTDTRIHSRAQTPLRDPISPRTEIPHTPIQQTRTSPTVELIHQRPVPLLDSPGIGHSPTAPLQQSPILLPDVIPGPIPALTLSRSSSVIVEVWKRGRMKQKVLGQRVLRAILQMGETELLDQVMRACRSR